MSNRPLWALGVAAAAQSALGSDADFHASPMELHSALSYYPAKWGSLECGWQFPDAPGLPALSISGLCTDRVS